MGRLIDSMLISLDGYVADADGRFGWATPDDGVLRFVPLELEWRESRCFEMGTVALRYAVRGLAAAQMYVLARGVHSDDATWWAP